ncbi:hypothetical protein Tco_0542425 [Tanacetum coccineum]
MANVAMKHIASNFAKLDKFEGVDSQRWQKKRHFLLSSMSVVYVLTTPILEDGENATMEQIRKRNKWENDDYVCRGLILNELSLDPYSEVVYSHDNGIQSVPAATGKGPAISIPTCGKAMVKVMRVLAHVVLAQGFRLVYYYGKPCIFVIMSRAIAVHGFRFFVSPSRNLPNGESITSSGLVTGLVPGYVHRISSCNTNPAMRGLRTPTRFSLAENQRRKDAGAVLEAMYGTKFLQMPPAHQCTCGGCRDPPAFISMLFDCHTAPYRWCPCLSLGGAVGLGGCSLTHIIGSNGPSAYDTRSNRVSRTALLPLEAHWWWFGSFEPSVASISLVVVLIALYEGALWTPLALFTLAKLYRVSGTLLPLSKIKRNALRNSTNPSMLQRVVSEPVPRAFPTTRGIEHVAAQYGCGRVFKSFAADSKIFRCPSGHLSPS